MLKLERFERKYFTALKEWVTDERLMAQWCGGTFTWPLDDAQLEGYLESMKQGCDFGYAALDGRNSPVGHIRIGRLDRENKTAVIMCVLIAPQHRGKGYGKAMTALAVERAFTILGIGTLALNVFTFNTTAIKTYEALGFRQVEYKQDSFDFKDEKWDKIKMKLEKMDWAEARRK